jgi:hypothetical protein
VLLRLTIEARVSGDALARLPELMDSGERVALLVVPPSFEIGYARLSTPGDPGASVVAKPLAEGALVGAVEAPSGSVP